MDIAELEDASLDCWVERAELLRLNPDPPISGQIHSRKFTSDPDLALPIIDRERIIIEQINDPDRGMLSFAYKLLAGQNEAPVESRIWPGYTDFEAAMLCYVVSVFGEAVEFKVLYDGLPPSEE
jgi:hypothetical protein